MPASFCFDLRGEEGAAEGNPVKAVKALDSKENKFAKPALYQLYPNVQQPIPKDVKISANQALYMKGTNGELSQALDFAKLANVSSFFVDNGELAVWYIRRQDSETSVLESIVCIAGRGDGPHYYWRMRNDQTPADRGPPAGYWKEMKHSEERSVTLKELVHEMLPRLNDEPAWYPGFPTKVTFPDPPISKRPWHWTEVDAKLREFQVGYLTDKYLFSDVLHAKLYVGDDDLRGAPNSDQPQFHGTQLIKSAILRDFGFGAGDLIFGTIGIMDDRNGLQVGQIDALRRVVSKLQAVLPDAQRFRYAELPGLKKGVTMASIVALRSPGDAYEVLTHGKLKPSVAQSEWDDTGDKVHVSVDPTQIGDSWDIVSQILLYHHETIKIFKVTDMDLVGLSRATDEKARRIYDGAQITVYFHAAPHAEKRAAQQFAQVMKLVSWSLGKANIRAGEQPPGELAVNKYLSFRHSFDDLIDPDKFKDFKERCNGMSNEEEYTAAMDYRPDNSDRYGKHLEMMKNRQLYGELLRNK